MKWPHPKQQAEPQCSFCAKKQDEVTKLVAGPKAFICNECVLLCVQIMLEDHPEWRQELDKAKPLQALLPTQNLIMAPF
jgi:ATP-dependent protease Clp ATPase subunit